MTSIDGAFDARQLAVNADFQQVKCARERRELFKQAFRGEQDVQEVFGSGSLARSTQLKPVHDVDMIIVFDPTDHPDWGSAGASSLAALEHVAARTRALIGPQGTVASLVRQVNVAGRDRAVKCFVDPPDAPDAFTVDAMPALRQGDGTLLIPSARNGAWNTADPEYLIKAVATAQAEWQHFRPTVRVLKDWRLDLGTPVKSLVLEVLALKCLPRSGGRADALRQFFTASAVEVNYGVSDPAGHCGAIQPDLDVSRLSAALGQAGRTADLACTAAADGDTTGALRLWQSIFGPDFPAPEPAKVGPGVAAATLIRPRPIKDAPQG